MITTARLRTCPATPLVADGHGPQKPLRDDALDNADLGTAEALSSTQSEPLTTSAICPAMSSILDSLVFMATLSAIEGL